MAPKNKNTRKTTRAAHGARRKAAKSPGLTAGEWFEKLAAVQARESGDDTKFAEEMGDLLLQIVFHSQIAKEEGRFSVSDVIREVHDKMVRRHPHVFGETRAKDSAEVLRNWEHIKAEERLSNRKEGD